MTTPKLFRLTKQFVADYSRTEDPKEEFFISDDIGKVRTFIAGKYNIQLDANNRASHYFKYDEGSDEYRLEEVETTSLL